MGPEQLLARLITGNLRNVRFRDFCVLAEAFAWSGFAVATISTGTLQYRLACNLQDRRGEAKPYQVRQLLAIVEEWNLRLEKP